MKLISETKLAEKLQVNPETVAEWRRDGLIKPFRVLNRMPQYIVEDIDAFLQHKKAKNHRVVQAIDILEDRVKLMNLGEVAKRMGASQQALSHRVRCGRYPALWVGGELRMVATDVEGILADATNPDYIGREMAAHILGSPTHFIRHLVRQGDLHSITVYTKPPTMPITRESMLTFIGKVAPSWVNPEAWVAEREKDERPLMTLGEVVHFLGLPHNAGRDMLKRRRLAHLNIKGKVLMISPVAAMLLLQEQDKLTDQQLAGIFGVDEAAIRRAKESGDLWCNFHYHTINDLRRGCVVEMLRTCLSQGAKYEIRWFEYYLRNPKILMTISEAAARYKIPEQEVIVRIQNGKLRAIRLPGPNSQWRIEGPAH